MIFNWKDKRLKNEDENNNDTVTESELSGNAVPKDDLEIFDLDVSDIADIPTSTAETDEVLKETLMDDFFDKADVSDMLDIDETVENSLDNKQDLSSAEQTNEEPASTNPDNNDIMIPESKNTDEECPSEKPVKKKNRSHSVKKMFSFVKKELQEEISVPINEDEKLKKSCQMLELDEKELTDSIIKKAYYEKQREIREYQLPKENMLLLELKEHFDYLMEYLERKQNTYDTDFKSEITKLDTLKKQKEETLSWDDAVKDIGSVKRFTKKSKRKLLIWSTIFIILGFLLFPDTIAIINGNLKKIGIEDIQRYILTDELSTFEYTDNDNAEIEEPDISNLREKFSVIIPGAKIYVGLFEYETIDYPATIQTDKLILAKYTKSSEGTYFHNYIHGYQKKKITTVDFEGTWEGHYLTSKESASVSNLSIELKESDTPGIYKGICEITSENKKCGSYYIEAYTHENSPKLTIQGKSWINKPTFFIMQDFEAIYDVKTGNLIPQKENGEVYELSKRENN